MKGSTPALEGFERLVRVLREGKDGILRQAPARIDWIQGCLAEWSKRDRETASQR